MDEASARLLCPECGKNWQSSVSGLPHSRDTYHCPNCHASRQLAEFMRTDRDLETLQQFE